MAGGKLIPNYNKMSKTAYNISARTHSAVWNAFGEKLSNKVDSHQWCSQGELLFVPENMRLFKTTKAIQYKLEQYEFNANSD